ncbi:MAG TPA: hypothetical protein VGM56_11020 [Byssovorax sp.]|jgi:hypothetical protein
MTRPRSIPGFSALACALALAGCGGDDASQAASTGGGGEAATSASSSSMSSASTAHTSSTGEGGGGSSSSSTGGGGAGGGAPAPRCTPHVRMLVQATNVDDVALDPDFAYYTVDNGGMPRGGVYKVSLDGGAPVELTPSAQPVGLALTQGLAIFGDDTGGIYSVPITGGAKTQITATHGAPAHLITDGTYVYFSDDQATKRVVLGGGTPETLSSAIGFSLAIDGEELVIADFGGGNVDSAPLAGGGPTTMLATMQDGPLYPLVVDGDLVWADAGDLMSGTGTLMRLSPGGMPITISSGFPLFRPHGLVFDGTNFYLTADSGPSIVKVPAAGGAPTVVAGVASDSGIALSDACVYFGDPADGLGVIAK